MVWNEVLCVVKCVGRWEIIGKKLHLQVDSGQGADVFSIRFSQPRSADLFVVELCSVVVLSYYSSERGASVHGFLHIGSHHHG